MKPKRIAVLGAGWAGLAAAVEGVQAGAEVSVFELATQLGGRARSLPDGEPRLDNGQHIMIGAYQHCLALMKTLGVDSRQVLRRSPLQLAYPEQTGLCLPPGPPLLSFARGVLGHRSWPWAARVSLLHNATKWLLQGFRCAPNLSVAALCAGMHPRIQAELMAPLCVAALNTHVQEASAQVFLRVLQDALFSGPGSADLLLPCRPLGELLPEPAQAWLSARGATVRLGQRAQFHAAGQAWQINDEVFDAVVLATPAREAARLTAMTAPDWSAQAAALQFEPIVTVYLSSPGSRLRLPMLALHEGPDAPAQFIFDLGQLGHAPGLFALVVSGAAAWVARGLDACGHACLAQAVSALDWHVAPTIWRVLSEKRATFACTPGLQRPPAAIQPGLWAAGDYVQGPYPATLEGAVRAGQFAMQEALRESTC